MTAIEIEEMAVTDRRPKNKDAPPDSPPEDLAAASKGGDGSLSVKAKT